MERQKIMVKNVWTIIKNRYRLSAKAQMNFELGFPDFLIGKCRATADNGCEIRTKKVCLSIKGIVFSDTIPLSWFTSSVFIPWEKVVETAVCGKTSSIDGSTDRPVSSHFNQHPPDSEYCTIKLNDPQKITIDLPWSKKFTDYVQRNKLFEV